MTEAKYVEDVLRPDRLTNRLKAAWAVLRGRSVMFRFAIEFVESPNFIGHHGLIEQCYFNSKDGSMPYANGIPMREYIGKDNRWSGMGIWDDSD